MIDYTLLSLFIPTFLFVAATPGLCMTLALTLGMTIGIKRTLWMMWGELLGVATVTILTVAGVASLMLKHPDVFQWFKYAGAAYLIYVGIQQWRSRGRLKLDESCEKQSDFTPLGLAVQGYIAAVANPKGWAFFVSLLPPFINPDLPMVPQLSILITIILMSEFLFMMIYASGGKALSRLLKHSENVRLINRISGSLMIGVGCWLALG